MGMEHAGARFGGFLGSLVLIESLNFQFSDEALLISIPRAAQVHFDVLQLHRFAVRLAENLLVTDRNAELVL